MIGLLRRVTQASVEVEGGVVGEIGPGMLVQACAEPADTEASAAQLLERLLSYLDSRRLTGTRCRWCTSLP